MGHATWDAFFERLGRHRRNVDEQFAQVFGEERGTDGGGDPLGTLLAASTDEATAVALLEEAGFAAAPKAWSLLARYRDTIALKMPDALAHERLARLMPDLLRAVATQTNAVTTLERVMSVIESVAKRSVYLALLAERSIALSQFVQLCAASPWIAQLLGRHPVLFDELLDPRTLYAPLAHDELDEDIAARLNALDDPDREHEMDCLRQSQAGQRPAGGGGRHLAPDPAHGGERSPHLDRGGDPARHAGDGVARHHRPPRSAGDDGRDAAFPPYAVVAYGKLGGIELGYGSDLDLVFVHDDDTSAMTTGAKPIDLATFYARLTQRLIHTLTTMTPQGMLYEVDPRLRPDGSKGVLVNTLDGLGEYLREKAWTWEHQALVRARAVAGDPGSRGDSPISAATSCCATGTETRCRGEVREMRERMRSELGSRRSGPLRPEAGPGRGRGHRVHRAVRHAALGVAAGRRPRLDRQHSPARGIRAGRPDAGRGACPARGRVPRLPGRIHQLSLQASEAVVDDDEFAGLRRAVAGIWDRVMASA